MGFNKFPISAKVRRKEDHFLIRTNNIFGIIIENEVIVYSTPFSNQEIEQSVFYSGNKVKIHQKTNLWIEVSTFDGRKGWIRALDVRNLN